jgi:hypothetical protein
MKIYILLLLLSSTLNAMDSNALGDKSNQSPPSIDTEILGNSSIDSFDDFFDSSTSSSPTDRSETDENITSPSKNDENRQYPF